MRPGPVPEVLARVVLGTVARVRVARVPEVLGQVVLGPEVPDLVAQVPEVLGQVALVPVARVLVAGAGRLRQVHRLRRAKRRAGCAVNAASMSA